jgi:hypothetical protein
MRHIVWAILLPGMITVAGAKDGDHRAWIEQTYAAGSLSILPHIAAGHTARLRYELVSIKSDANGNASKTHQSNSLELTQGQIRTLSRLRLSVHPGDHYTLTLKVFENERMVAQDAITYPD